MGVPPIAPDAMVAHSCTSPARLSCGGGDLRDRWDYCGVWGSQRWLIGRSAVTNRAERAMYRRPRRPGPARRDRRLTGVDRPYVLVSGAMSLGGDIDRAAAAPLEL